MPFSAVLQLELPELFPLEEFEAYYYVAREVLPQLSEFRSEFNRAANTVGWRFRACLEHKEALCQSWAAHGPHSFEALYHQERNLFEMFVCGVASIESIVYSAYAVLAYTTQEFPFDEGARKGRTSPERLANDLDAMALSIGFRSELRELVDSQEWRIWKQYRNTMAHRSSVPRLIQGVGGGGSPPPPLIFQYAKTWSTEPLEGNEQELDAHIRWLSDAARGLFHAGQNLALSSQGHG